MSKPSLSPSLDRNLAEAALECALNPIHNMGPRERATTLMNIADNHPQVIEAEIAKMNRLIRELRDYLPKEAKNG